MPLIFDQSQLLQSAEPSNSHHLTRTPNEEIKRRPSCTPCGRQSVFARGLHAVFRTSDRSRAKNQAFFCYPHPHLGCVG